MKYPICYRISNHSQKKIGPLDLNAIFGHCNASNQSVFINPGEEISFSAANEDETEVQDRLRLRVRELGTKTGDNGIIMDRRPVVILEERKPTAPVPNVVYEPPDEAG